MIENNKKEEGWAMDGISTRRAAGVIALVQSIWKQLLPSENAPLRVLESERCKSIAVGLNSVVRKCEFSGLWLSQRFERLAQSRVLLPPIDVHSLIEIQLGKYTSKGLLYASVTFRA